IYACGVLLYELLAGRLPFDGHNPREVVLMHLSKPPPDLHLIAPDRNIPDALVEVVMKALSKAPTDRFGSASAFARALRATVQPIERAPAATMLCDNCGASMPAAQKFCGECGTRMSVLPPADLATVAEAPEPFSVPEILPFVGRDDELGWMFERRDEATTAFVACQLVGHAGAGKTRLVEEFTRHADHWGDVVVVTGPDPWGAEAGYHALKKAVAALAALPPDGGGPSHWPGASPEVRAGLN